MTKKHKNVDDIKSDIKTRRSLRLKAMDSSLSSMNLTSDMIDCIGKMFKRVTESTELQLGSTDGGGPNKALICDRCDSNFFNELLLRQHILVHHLQADPERYECQKCGNTVTDLVHHFQRHRDALLVSEHCGHPFSNNESYRGHIHTRNRENSRKCTICPARLLTIAKLRAHLSLHESCRDADGNYQPLTARLQRHPNYDSVAMSSNSKPIDSQCGTDIAGVCIKHDTALAAMRNVMINSKCCDTSDIEEFGGRAANMPRLR